MPADPYAPALPPDAVVAGGLFLHRLGTPRRWLLLQGRRSREWGFPKGHADPGETLVQTALRETAEETGLGLVAITAPPLLLTYTVPSGRTKVVAYFPAMTADDAVRLSPEHIAFRWGTDTETAALLPHPTLRRLFTHHLTTLC